MGLVDILKRAGGYVARGVKKLGEYVEKVYSYVGKGIVRAVKFVYNKSKPYFRKLLKLAFYASAVYLTGYFAAAYLFPSIAAKVGAFLYAHHSSIPYYGPLIKSAFPKYGATEIGARAIADLLVVTYALRSIVKKIKSYFK